MKSSETRKEQLSKLISNYNGYKKSGRLDLSSEETIRTWLNELLKIFNWDVRDTSQVLQEKILSKKEREKLEKITSTHIKPDYSFKLSKKIITFLDAKNLDIKIENDSEAAFQIKSYGWSVSAPCAFVSNFEQLAIYDCTYIPERSQPPILGRIYLRIEEYLDNFDVLDQHLLKENVYHGQLDKIYKDTLSGETSIKKISTDYAFAELLSSLRKKLAKNILLNNPKRIKNDFDLLSYFVQVIINRIIFIRVCEARNIEKDGLLKEFSDTGFWDAFKKSSYFDFYTHYDGPLFERIKALHSLNISDDIFDEFLTWLYYPSPYRFDVIPVTLLSDIYELFLSKKIVIKGKKVTDVLKSEYVKTKGAVSTPDYIVKEIVRRTINKQKIAENGLKKLLENKILDLACGSGTFLIEAYDYLEDIFIELYETSDGKLYKDFIIELDNEKIINLEGKRAIINSCLFGVDIDPEAVEVAKLSLSLKIIDSTEYQEHYNDIGIFGDKILSRVGNSIRCGNSLVSKDILNKYPELYKKKNLTELIRTNCFGWDSKEGFKEIIEEKGGFDFIIGNPPYVEVKNYNVELPSMHKYIKSVYPSAKNGKIDIAVPFIEKGLDLLNPNGRLGFIIQKRFFKTEYGKKIREIISSNKYISSILDFKTTSIFKDRLTYVALMSLFKSGANEFYYKLLEDEVEILPFICSELKIPETDPSDYMTLPSEALSSSTWIFDEPELLKIRTKLLKHGKSGDFFSVRVGLQVLWDKAYHIRPIKVSKKKIVGKTHLEEEFEIESDACRPVICNENFIPFRSDEPDIYVIFPFDITDGNNVGISFSDFKKRYPLAGTYLERNKSKIVANVETNPDDEWHQFTRVQNHTRTFPKVLIPMTARDTLATISLVDKLYCDNVNVNFIEIEEKTENNLYALAGIINSTVYSVLTRSIANPQSGGYYKFNKQFIDPVPFPVKNFKDNKDGLVTELAECAKDIQSQQEKYLSSAPTQKRTMKILLEKNWEKLDEIVFKLYELNSAEKKFFKNKGRNVDRIEFLESYCE